MGGVKHLAKNTGYLLVGQFSTKILSFFLVPLYTSVLTTEEYGTFDFIGTTVSLMIPLLTLNICDSALRFSIDKDSDKNEIFTISIYHFILSILLGIVLLVCNYIFNVVPIIKEYSLYTLLMYGTIALNGILNSFARGIDKMREVAISGIISSIVVIGLSIIFLLGFNMTLDGFFLANIIGGLVQCIYIFLATHSFNYFHTQIQNKKLHNEMIAYCKPMIVNNISWWVNNASSRYVIVWLCGLSSNGILSVAYKIPSILIMFQGIFNQAWSITATQEFDKDDKNHLFTNLYNSYNVLMVICCSFLIALSKPIASLLYADEFFEAWRYAPMLLISAVFGSLSGYLGGIFSAVKDTKVFAKTTVYGAIVNIVITLTLVPFCGIMGAVIASLVSYFVIWTNRVVNVKKHVNIKIDVIKDCLSYGILISQSVALLYLTGWLLIVCETLLVLGLVVINRRYLQIIMNKLYRFIK